MSFSTIATFLLLSSKHEHTSRLCLLASHITTPSTILSLGLIYCQLENVSNARSTSHQPSEPLIFISPPSAVESSPQVSPCPRAPIFSQYTLYSSRYPGSRAYLPAGALHLYLVPHPRFLRSIRCTLMQPSWTRASSISMWCVYYCVVRLLLSVAEKVSFVGLESSSGNGEGEGGGER